MTHKLCKTLKKKKTFDEMMVVADSQNGSIGRTDREILGMKKIC